MFSRRNTSIGTLLGAIVYGAIRCYGIYFNNIPPAPAQAYTPIVSPSAHLLPEPSTFYATYPGVIVDLNCPPGWVTYELHDTADIEIANLARNLYLIVLSEPKTDYAGTLRQYSDDTCAFFVEGMSQMHITEDHLIQIDGNPAIQRTLDGTFDRINFGYMHTCIETEGYFHQILAWTPASKFPQAKPVLQTIVMSFRETSAVTKKQPATDPQTAE